ncbi:MAG: rod shape-determining protein MreD [Clostridia bacterium]|nr:rod shape-determining protein MreD [Clostridia bacterium]
MFSKQYTSLKILVYSLLCIFCYILQSADLPFMRFLGTAPELLLVLCLCVAYRESETFAAFFGLGAGLLNDIVTENIVGMSAIFFMFLSFAIAVMLRTLLRNFFTTYIFTVLAAVLGFLLIEYVFHCIFIDAIPLWSALINTILPKLFFTGVLAYPLYFITGLFEKKLWPGGENA